MSSPRLRQEAVRTSVPRNSNPAAVLADASRLNLRSSPGCRHLSAARSWQQVKTMAAQ